MPTKPIRPTYRLQGRCLVHALLALALLGPAGAQARTSLETLLLTPGSAIPLYIAGTSTVVGPDQSVMLQPGGHKLAPSLGLPVGSGINAYYESETGAQLFVPSATVNLGGVDYEPHQVVRKDGPLTSLYFDAPSAGVPNGIGIDAFSIDASGDLLLSFDAAFTVMALSVEPDDLVKWDGVSFTTYFSGASVGIGGLDLDAAAYLPVVDTVLLSFDRAGRAGGVVFEDEDVLEYFPSSGDIELSVDASDYDLDWETGGTNALHATVGRAYVNAAETARIIMRDVSPGTNPALYELRLQCGTHRVTQLSTGVYIHPDVMNAEVEIGECNTLGCTSGPDFGATVDGAAATIDYPPGVAPERDDAVYVTLPASGGTGALCDPNQDVFLANVRISGLTAIELPHPTPMLTQEGAGESLRDDGVLERSNISLQWGPADPDYEIVLRPRFGDSSGLEYEVVLFSDRQWTRVGFAILPPVGAISAIFGDCTALTGGAYSERTCLGATGLGPFVNAAASTTLGPSSAIPSALGGYGNALYVSLVGSMVVSPGLPAFGALDGPRLLGTLSYTPDVPMMPLDLGAVSTWGTGVGDNALDINSDIGGIPVSGNQNGGLIDPNQGGSSDADTIPDGVDNCWPFPNESQSDVGGVDSQQNPDGVNPDDVGDPCQCGDVSPVGDPQQIDPNGVGRVNSIDSLLIQQALAGLVPLSDTVKLRCNVNGPKDIGGGMGMPPDCEISDAMRLERVFLEVDPADETLLQCTPQ